MTKEQKLHSEGSHFTYRSNGRKIILAVIVFVAWSVAYGMLVLGLDVIQASIRSLSTISNLVEDAVVVIVLGSLLVAFFILSDFYIKISIDTHAFVRIEQVVDDFAQDRKFWRFVRRLVNFPKVLVEPDRSPIPRGEVFTILFLGIYYLINFVGILFMTEILFFTFAGENFQLEPSQEVILPILAACLVVGGKVASLYYDYAHEYGQMLTETLFIFLLFGIVSSLHGTEMANFVDVIAGEHALPRFLSIIIYLAMIPVAVEITKWFLYLKGDEPEQPRSDS